MVFVPKPMGHKFCAALLLLTLASAELRLPRSSLTGRGSHHGFKKDGRFPSMKGMVWMRLNPQPRNQPVNHRSPERSDVEVPSPSGGLLHLGGRSEICRRAHLSGRPHGRHIPRQVEASDGGAPIGGALGETAERTPKTLVCSLCSLFNGFRVDL